MEKDHANEIILYQAEDTLALDIRVEDEPVWLNRNQIVELFGRDIKTIGKHIANALKEELAGMAVVAKFATTAADDKTQAIIQLSGQNLFGQVATDAAPNMDKLHQY